MLSGASLAVYLSGMKYAHLRIRILGYNASESVATDRLIGG